MNLTNDASPRGSATSVVVSYLMLALVWIIGGGSLPVFFFVFVFLGPVNLVNLGWSEPMILFWDTFLCLVFFVQHSGMIRRACRRWSARFIPEHYTGAVYSIASGIALLTLVALWQESTSVLAEPEGVARWLMRGLYFLAILGFAWVKLALGSFDALGVQPIVDRLRHRTTPPLPFIACGPYRWMRHPMYTFSLLMFWSYPDLTTDRLLFNFVWTIWIFVGSILEERDLVAVFGEAYRDYQRKVPMLIPYRWCPLK